MTDINIGQPNNFNRGAFSLHHFSVPLKAKLTFILSIFFVCCCTYTLCPQIRGYKLRCTTAKLHAKLECRMSSCIINKLIHCVICVTCYIMSSINKDKHPALNHKWPALVYNHLHSLAILLGIHMAGTWCFYPCRHGQGDHLKVKLSIRMGNKCNLSNCEMWKGCFLIWLVLSIVGLWFFWGLNIDLW